MKKIRIIFASIVSLFLIVTSIVPLQASDAIVTGEQKVVVVGDDWGPAVVKTIVTLDTVLDASSIEADDFSVTEIKEAFDWGSFQFITASAQRTVIDAYVSDANGNKVDATTGSIITLEMYSSPSEGSPFIYNVFTGRNSWCNEYQLDITLNPGAHVTSNKVAIAGISITSVIDLKDPNQRISEVADDFDMHTFQSSSGASYTYGEYTPAPTNRKRPLVIWLHGAGEGGYDNYIDLLGNEVTALASTEFQSLFNGAYVLTPQSPTMWLDGANMGAKPSKYTEDLMELITSYVASNPNIDTDRILIGGCSNGGYMTMEMILTYPEYFAAAYPICEAYADVNISDAQIQTLIDNEIGIWFVHSMADTTVRPNGFTIDTYDRLLAAGAKNVHISLSDKVLDTTGRFTNVDGSPYEYAGHWSWIYFFNNECMCDECGDSMWSWLSKQTQAEEKVIAGEQKVVVTGEDWGPAVYKTIITLEEAIDADSLDIDDFSVTEFKETFDWVNFVKGEGVTEREIVDVYVCDANGKRLTTRGATGSHIAMEMYVSPDEGSPFLYDIFTGFNDWCAYYKLEVSLTVDSIVTSNGELVTQLAIEEDINLRDRSQTISEVADDFAMHTYTADSGETYSYGEYVPTTTSEKSPLVIWLHGAGEGGSDNYIDLLGNEVTALAGTEFQSLFDGAYILTPQSPTMWMDDGTGNYQSGDKGSCYTEDLMALITSYVASNPNIDTDRILIGGCSNGGYMTMEMILTYPEYFAAAYPICEAFNDAFITDEQIQALVDNEVGIWFTHALNDSTVNPQTTTIPTYNRLIEAGANNVYLSLFDTVVDTTGRFFNEDGSAYEYNGHWSWVYFFNNECKDEDGNRAWNWLASQTKATEVPQIDVKVTLDIESAQVEQGKTLQFTAEVEAAVEIDTSVTWTITGNTSDKTTISKTGLLTVSQDEEVGNTITVTATSNYDTNASASAEVKVVKVGSGVSVKPTKPGATVSTADVTSISIFIALSLISITGMAYSYKKKKRVHYKNC